jgi:hypothetical protein
MISRRNLLAGTGLVVVGGVLEACGNGTTPTVTPANVVTTAQNAISTLVNLASVEGPSLSPAQQSVVATIMADANQAKTVVAQLQAGMTATAGAPIVQQVETDLNNVVDAVAMVPLPPPYNAIIAAVALGLPILEGFLSTVMPATAGASLAVLTARQKVVAAAPAMTQDQALALLAQHAGR